MNLQRNMSRVLSWLLLGIAGPLYAQHPLNNLDEEGVILKGYDPVAYFTEQKAVKGNPQYQSTYQEAVYYFASAEHKQLFDQNPVRYEVQFGGYCAYAASLGRTADIDPENFCYVQQDDQGVERLICQHNQRAQDGWEKDAAGNLRLAYQYWPEIVKHQGKQIVTDEEKKFYNNIDKEGVILQGYDVVAYFTEGKPVKGTPAYSARYEGATYWFASEEHQTLFKNQSRQYAPQYGAFCGYAMSLGKIRPTNPEIFQVVEGRLILQHTQDAYELFNKDLPGNVEKADGHWPKVQASHAGKKVKFDKRS